MGVLVFVVVCAYDKTIKKHFQNHHYPLCKNIRYDETLIKDIFDNQVYF